MVASFLALTPRVSAQSQEAQRESWQRVPDIFAAMGIGANSIVADIGAGQGFFTTRLAKAVGESGRVYAVDISAATLDRLRTRIAAEGFTHVVPILGAADDPKLPAATLDAALIVNAYHEMTAHQAMLAAIRRALKPGGRLVIVESFITGQGGVPRANQESRHFLAPQHLQRDAIEAGFVITRVESPFTRHGGPGGEYLTVLEPTPPPLAPPPGNGNRGSGPMDESARRPDDVVAALELKSGRVVADIGAASGIFTRRFARVVEPGGRALGLDVDAAAVDAMKKDATTLGLRNYEARLVAPDDPGLTPTSVDMIVDFPAGSPFPDHPDQKQAEAELASAGYRVIKTHTFLSGQYCIELVAR
ncbi:MAG TPA: methyltransferase domain-containing protein [Vicinamibacterales bacterium]|nr:methyltransferase domain-containing protein [Vicinamibacterales bacterium]